MIKKQIKKFSINEHSSIKNALIKLRKCGTHCLLVSSNNKLLGTCSDGDIRKKLILGYNINKKITDIFNKKPQVLQKKSYTIFDVERIFKKQIDIVPIIDQNNKIVEVYLKEKFHLLKKKNLLKKKKYPIVIMAGGMGTRMKPFTKVLPKPLIPIQNKPVISHIIEVFRSFNFNKFFVSINKKDQIIKTYLKENFRKYNLKFIEEKISLGPLGALKLLHKKIKDDFFVSVSDTIIKLNFEKLIEFHYQKKSMCTIVVSKQSLSSNYGNCIIEKDKSLIKIDEKPKIKQLVSVGLYFFSRDVLKLLPAKNNFSILDIINIAKDKKLKIFTYEISNNNWKDSGNWNDFKKLINISDKIGIFR